MAYLVNVGVFERNRSGVGSRGYQVFGRGTTVKVVWGAIRVEHGGRARFYWARTTQHVEHVFDTTGEAAECARMLVKFRIGRRYRRLPTGVIIRRPAGVGSALRRR